MEFNLPQVKDLGLQRVVYDALPYAVVGESWTGTFDAQTDESTVMSHIVPTGQQLKILFLRVWTQEAGGAVFHIEQTNPTAVGATGAVEAYPVVGNTPSGVRDYPMLEAAGAEVLHGSLRDPIQVCEGSIDFAVLWTPNPATGARYGITWWGVEKIPQQK